MMTWHDAESTWSRKLKRRLLFKMLLCLASFVLTVAVIAMFWWLNNSITTFHSDSSLRNITLWVFVPLGLSQAIYIAYMYFQILRERAVLRDVPEHDGLVCPRCLTILDAAATENRCPKCNTPYTVDELHSYWVDYSLAQDRIRPWGTESTWRRRLSNFKKLAQSSIRAQLILQVLTIAVALIVFRLISGTSFIGSLIQWGPFFIAITLCGPAGVYHRRYRERSGQTRHCAKCDYQQAPEGKNPYRCPECGADWNRPRGVVTGKQHREPRNLWAACTLYGFAALVMIMYIMSRSQTEVWMMKIVPTSTLIHDATNSMGFTRKEWAEIGRRQLTQEEQLQLATGLIDMRLRSDYLDSTEGGWLWSLVSTGALPDDLVDRYYREMLEVWIETPSIIRQGVLFEVSLGSNFRRSNPPSGIDKVIYFGGFFMNEDPTPFGRQDDDTYAGLMDQPDYLLKADLQPDHTGPLTIRAVLYFGIGPALAWAKPPAQWKEDETATIPSVAVWSHRIEVKKVVQVVE